MRSNWLDYNCMLLQLLLICLCSSQHIPLTYAYLSDFNTTVPIEFAFNSTLTLTPDGADILRLFNLNLSVQTHLQKGNKVVLGLAYPSQFLGAVAAMFKMPYEAIELSKKESIELVLNDENYVETRDVFVEGGAYDVRVMYNYGNSFTIGKKSCRLIDGDKIYFDQILIREVLNGMSIDNKIQFEFDSIARTVTLSGQLENFPQITLMMGTSLFRIPIKSRVLNYIQSSEISMDTLVGFQTLSEFTKMKFGADNSVIFKRTSLLFMLYIFLGYFFLLSVGLVYWSSKEIHTTTEFVKSLAKWVCLKDMNARVIVLTTELE